MKQTKIIDQFIAAERANVPLVAINTPDPASTIAVIKKVYSGARPMVQWDIINGIVALNSAATDYVNTINRLPDGSTNPAIATGNPVEALMKMPRLPQSCIIFFHNAHMYVDKVMPGNMAPPVIQAIWNLRDFFKKVKTQLVMLAPNFTIPDELQHDVLLMDEPLPSDTELQGLITKAFVSNGLKAPRKNTMPAFVDATSGLAPFAIDQVIKMSVQKTRSGKPKIDMESLWQKKIMKIENTVGLKIHRTGPRFHDIGGNDNIKDLLLKIAKSETCPRLVVFIDEIEKAMQAAGTDTSGVTTDQLKVLLTEMQNNEWTGLICYGFPGTGKSELSKAFGRECGALTVEADLGAMKHIWVGSSEARMRNFVKIIKAMGGSRVFFMATCNHIAILRPELKRRFKKGIFFSDLPDDKEREVIWNLYLKKFNLMGQVRPMDRGWTGAEIRVCCETANELKISLVEACRFMTIVSHAMGSEGVTKMRQEASGKYISTQHPGVYTFQQKQNYMGV